MITFHYKDNVSTVIIKTESGYITDVVEEFRKFLLATGFHPDNVKGALPDAP